MIGLASGTVKIVPYMEEWKKLFEQEKNLIVSKIGALIKDIQHVGSTSIPGLESKPIIDIAVAVDKLDIGILCVKPLCEIGYEYKQDAGIPGRHFFAKGVSERRTHYLHVEELNGQLWKNHILFRDYLCKHKELVEEYTKLKKELAMKYENDRDTYSLGKNSFIERIIRKAEIELDS